MPRYLRVAVAAVMSLVAAALLAYWFCPKPELESYTPYSTAYLDANAQLLRLGLAADQRYRLPVKLDDIAPALVEATILYEDQNYYSHSGLDVAALARAFWDTYITKKRRIGASTLVMQVARLRWSIPSHKLHGKFWQIIRALQLSRHYSKREILQAYFNMAPYGRNIEGVGAASLIYFDKQASQLNLLEALSLAVVPQNPNQRTPSSRSGYANLIEARRYLFERWLKHHPEAATVRKYLDLPMAARAPEALPFRAPHFVDFVRQQASNWQTGYVDTSLDLILQTALEQRVRQYIASRRSLGIENTAVLIINYRTAQIKAMLGSADFFDQGIMGQVNGTLAKRSPGSTLKPFVYALAMDEGLIHPLTLLKDAPKRFGGFSPENYDRRFLGPISARDALIQSRNVPAVDLQARLQRHSFYDFLVQAGVSQLRDEAFYGLALALGGGELTALELGRLYVVLANGGVDRRIGYLKRDQPEPGVRLLSRESSFLVLDILKDNPPPAGRQFNHMEPSQREVAWKTGTSWAFRDAWAIAVSGDYVALVWVGNFSGKGNNAFIGRSAAGPLLFDLLALLPGPLNWSVAAELQPESLNLRRLDVCTNTGDLAETLCPKTTKAWFIPGVSPIRLSNVYREIAIDTATGLRACNYDSQTTAKHVYEFWPSDLLDVFSKAGISLRTPPPYLASCSLGQKSATGKAPSIVSPQSGVKYVYRLNNTADNLIPLLADADADVKRLHWFINDRYLGAADRNQAFWMKAEIGQFSLRVVDDAGRSDSQPLTVITH